MMMLRRLWKVCSLNLIVLVAVSAGFVSQLLQKDYNAAAIAGIAVAVNAFFVWDLWRQYGYKRDRQVL